MTNPKTTTKIRSIKVRKAAAQPGAQAEAAPDDAAPAPASPKGKIAILVSLLRRPEGARIPDMMQATGWQAHSVRGAMSGAIKKTLGLAVSSDKVDGIRVYRMVPEAEG